MLFFLPHKNKLLTYFHLLTRTEQQKEAKKFWRKSTD